MGKPLSQHFIGLLKWLDQVLGDAISGSGG